MGGEARGGENEGEDSERGWSGGGWPGLVLLNGESVVSRYWGIICEVSCEGIEFKMEELVEYHGEAAQMNAEVD